jgi:biopolymer transport protein ExbD
MRRFRRVWLAFAASAAAAALIADPACAQTAAPAKAEKMQKKTAASVVVVVTNSRSVALTELDATPSGQFIPKRMVSRLAPGAKTSVVIATDKDCVYDLRGMYSDSSITELPSVDLCKDHSVNLVD